MEEDMIYQWKFLSDQNARLFKQNSKKTAVTNRSLQLEVELISSSKPIKAQLVIYPFNDQQCCVFRPSNSIADNTRFLEIVAKRHPQRWFIVDFDLLTNEFSLIDNSQWFCQGFPGSPGKAGQTHRQDLILDEVKGFTSEYRSLTELKPQVLIPKRIYASPNGETHYYDNFIYLLNTSPSGVIRLLHVTEDVTDLQNAQEALLIKTKSVEELGLVMETMKCCFDNSPLIMGAVDVMDDKEDCVNVFCNPACLKFKQLPAERMRGTSSVEVGCPLDFISACHATAKSGNALEFDIPCDMGRYMTGCLHSVGPKRVAYILQDITDRKELEEQLRKTNEELEVLVKERTKELQRALEVKSRFLATMSHEIRTPLHGVMSVLQLLEGSALTPEQQWLIQLGKVCGEQLLIVINDILDITKMDESKLHLVQMPFSMHTVISDVLEIEECDAEKKRLDLVLDIDEDVPDIIIGDAARFRQVIFNLVSNAVKFSDKDGSYVLVTVKSKDIQDQKCEVTVTVEDHGIGIPKEARIFERFSQVDISISRRYGGTGLGLAISSELATLMGGSLSYSSEVGKGSCFTLKLIATVPEQHIKSIRCFFNQKLVVVVDTCEPLLKALQKAITKWGLKCQTFTSIEEACQTQKQAPCALINDSLIDLPTKDKLPFREVILMGHNRMQQTSKPFYLSKPVRYQSLLEILRSVLEPLTNTPKIPSKACHDECKECDKGRLNLTVLLAEDNLMNQQVIMKLMQRLGYTNVDKVENGKQAVEACLNKEYDIVLMDVMMPEMNGIEATELIRKSVSNQPYIIALTADAFEETKQKCLAVGMEEVITKPLQLSVLKQTLLKYST